MTDEAKKRKSMPVALGFMAYFPRAMKYVAHVSQVGNDQHHPDTPLHWDKTKSTDEADAGERHHLDHLMGNYYDTDGVLHLGKHAWRAMAELERFLIQQEEDGTTST